MGDVQSRGVQSVLRGKGFLVQAGPSLRMGTTYTAGVATISRGLRPMFHLPCRTKEGKEQHRLGRLQIIGCGIGARHTITLANVYGWARGSEDVHQALRTDHLLRAALDELSSIPDTEPTLIVGDFNADLADLDTTQRMLASGWTDLGSLYDTSPTCFAAATSDGTRRDYAFANAAALHCIIGFTIGHW